MNIPTCLKFLANTITWGLKYTARFEVSNRSAGCNYGPKQQDASMMCFLSVTMQLADQLIVGHGRCNTCAGESFTCKPTGYKNKHMVGHLHQG